ncbi:MAG: amino acid ABC transporter permease [Clostridia bacterium]|nr:amino acid ABC transporter permease [Clostridia bacterium]MCR4683255.1 amino acid ABC transporter permease [Clostridiales bacterium]
MAFFEKIITYLKDGFISTFITEDRYQLFLKGLGNTLLTALCATLVGIVIGALIAVVKTVHKQRPDRLKLLNSLAELYTTVIRGTPVVVQLLITYNIIFRWSTHPVLVGIAAFGINSGAYVSEIIRAGINAVDPGQTEAGRSLGLSSSVTMWKIVIPQAVKNVLPAIGNEFISLLKETSIIGYLGVLDITKAAERTISRTANVYFPYISIAIMYLAMVLVLNYFVKKLERRLAKSDRS